MANLFTSASKAAILETVLEIIKEDWNPTIEQLYRAILNWTRYGKQYFILKELKYLEISGSPKADFLKTPKKLKTVNTLDLLAFWIRSGIVLLEGIRKNITGYEINYHIKDKNGTSIIISENDFWKLLTASHSSSSASVYNFKGKESKLNFQNDPSTAIDQILSDNGYVNLAIDWGGLLKLNSDFKIILNRINFMEDFYLKKESISKYGLYYSTFYKKIKKGKVISNEKFLEEYRSQGWPPINWYRDMSLLDRYIMYKESRKKATAERKNGQGTYPVDGRNGVFYVYGKLLVIETDSETIYRLSANAGDLYEAVVHGAANILPLNEEEEWEWSNSNNNYLYKKYILTDHTINIDNMVVEKDSINFIKSGDNYFTTSTWKNNTRKQNIVALLTKLVNGQIAKNTVINLILRLGNIFDIYMSSTSNIELKKEVLINRLYDFFISTKNQSLFEEGADEEVSEKIDKAIQDNFVNNKNIENLTQDKTMIGIKTNIKLFVLNK